MLPLKIVYKNWLCFGYLKNYNPMTNYKRYLIEDRGTNYENIGFIKQPHLQIIQLPIFRIENHVRDDGCGHDEHYSTYYSPNDTHSSNEVFDSFEHAQQIGVDEYYDSIKEIKKTSEKRIKELENELDYHKILLDYIEKPLIIKCIESKN